MARAFHRAGDFPLVGGAQSGFPAFPNLSEAGNKTPKRYGVAEINISDIFFAKIAFHPSLLASLKATDGKPLAKDALPKL